MIWIIALIGMGFLLIIIEIFFVPGTVVGIVGTLLTGFGIYLVYKDLGASYGHLTLAITVTALLIAIIAGFRMRVWERYSNKDALQGKTNVITEEQIQIGDSGKAISAIKPIGKARINDDHFEVQSFSDFIDAGEDVEVTKISGKTIYVKRHEKA